MTYALSTFVRAEEPDTAASEVPSPVVGVSTGEGQPPENENKEGEQ